MNKEQQTIKAIQKAVPSIMELKFGCEIEANRSVDRKLCRGIIIENYGDCMWAIKNFNDHSQSGLINKETEIKIIGRPITTQDILKTRTDLAIDGFGGIFIRNHSDKEGKLWEMEYCGHYEIDKPFHLQSKETKELLYNLIVKE